MKLYGPDPFPPHVIKGKGRLRETNFQASGRRGQSGDSAYSIVYWTPKDCQTGDWIAKKEPAFHDQGTPHW